MGKTTAKSLFLVRKFIDERTGGTGFRSVYNQLTKDEKRQFDSLSSDSWAGYELYFRLLELGAQAMDAEVLKFCEDFGVYQAEHDTKILHRTAMRLGGPGVMIMEADQIWRRYHDTGHLKIYNILPNRASAKIEELEGAGPLLCAVLQGFIGKALILCGVKDLTMAHTKCRFRGDSVCEYDGRWK
jgi:hypothetical protein